MKSIHLNSSPFGWGPLTPPYGFGIFQLVWSFSSTRCWPALKLTDDCPGYRDTPLEDKHSFESQRPSLPFFPSTILLMFWNSVAQRRIENLTDVHDRVGLCMCINPARSARESSLPLDKSGAWNRSRDRGQRCRIHPVSPHVRVQDG